MIKALNLVIMFSVSNDSELPVTTGCAQVRAGGSCVCLCTVLQCATGYTEEVNQGKASQAPPSLATLAKDLPLS